MSELSQLLLHLHQTLGEESHEVQCDRGARRQQEKEVLPGNDGDHTVLKNNRRKGPLVLREQQFPKDLIWLENMQNRLHALGREKDQLDQASLQDVNGIARVAFREDRGSLRVSPLATETGDPRGFRLRDPLKQLAGSEEGSQGFLPWSRDAGDYTLSVPGVRQHPVRRDLL